MTKLLCVIALLSSSASAFAAGNSARKPSSKTKCTDLYVSIITAFIPSNGSDGGEIREFAGFSDNQGYAEGNAKIACSEAAKKESISCNGAGYSSRKLMLDDRYFSMAKYITNCVPPPQVDSAG